MVCMQVILLDILEKEGQEACSTLRKIYGKDRVMFYKCDVTSEDSLVMCMMYGV